METPKESKQLGSQWIRVPGKALLSGGYAIIYEDQQGLSLALDAFYIARVQKSKSKEDNKSKISLKNPQFPDSDFVCVIDDNFLREVLPQPNKFLSASVLIFTKFLSHHHKEEFLKFEYEITILQTANFYVSSENPEPFILPEEPSLINYSFCKYPFPLLETSKNGFGSSACVIVSVVSCLLYALDNSFLEHKELIYILSLMANYEAQQKIGSGFDIGRFYLWTESI
jgi:phosphomevalonate kinase